MLLLIAVLAFLSTAFLLFRLARRRDQKLTTERPFSLEPPPNARPLFAPSDDELRIESDRQKAIEIARREYRAKAKSRAIVDTALANWRTSSNRKTAIELLKVTADSGLEGDFSKAAAEIVELFDASGIDGFSSRDLAVLLDSHCRLLPEPERSSGELFWLKQEINKLLES